MKEILFNTALIAAGDFAREFSINISGSYLLKAGRGFTYDLMSIATGKTILSVTLHKSQVPTFTVWNY